MGTSLDGLISVLVCLQYSCE